MPIPHIGDYKEKKKKNYSSWYLLSFIIGIALFFILLFSTKLIVFIVGLAIKYWIYASIGVLVLLILIKKIKKRKRKKEFKNYEYPYR